MNNMGIKLGAIALLIGGILLLANVAFAAPGAGVGQVDPNKKAVCSCCSCNCCK